MKKTIRPLLSLLSLCLVVACNPKQQEPVVESTPPVDPISQPKSMEADSAMWAGTYKGVTPCTDCDGIETTLTLNADLTFELKMNYLGKDNAKPVDATGRFRWLPGGNAIVLDGLLNMPSQYSVGQNMLIQMDMMGQPVTGEAAGKYILIKQKGQSITIIKE